MYHNYCQTFYKIRVFTSLFLLFKGKGGQLSVDLTTMLFICLHNEFGFDIHTVFMLSKLAQFPTKLEFLPYFSYYLKAKVAN